MKPSASEKPRRLWKRWRSEKGAGGSDGPFSFAHVLDKELDCIREKRRRLEGLAPRETEAAPPAPPEASEGGKPSELEKDLAAQEQAQKRALSENLSGLAFSGGGIRSATFNLGIIQGLADLGLLHRFDYLSTVSGGGYIGSWLTALIDRENRTPPKKGEEPKAGILRVEEKLRTRRGADQEEEPAIKYLRRYSNYLTPRVGLLTADTWAVVATYLRNLLLNLLVVIPGLAVVLLVPRLIMAFQETLEREVAGATAGVTAGGPAGVTAEAAGGADPLMWAYFGLSIFLGVVATCMMGYSFASLTLNARKRADARREMDEAHPDPMHARGSRPFLQQSTVLQLLVFPLMISSFLASQWLPWAAGSQQRGWIHWACGAAFAYALSWTVAFSVALRTRWKGDQSFRRWGWLIGWALPSGAVCGLLLLGIARLLAGLDDWAAYTVGPPMVLAWFILLGALHTGLMGRTFFDSQREWLSRLGAWLMIFAGAWTLLFGVIVYGAVVLLGLKSFWQPAMASGWLAATLSGLLAAGKSEEKGFGAKIRRLVVAVAPYVFIAGLILFLAVGVDWAIGAIDRKGDVVENGLSWEKFWSERAALVTDRERYDEAKAAAEDAGRMFMAKPPGFWEPLYKAHGKLMRQGTAKPGATVLLFLALALAGGLLASRIDVNEFSMHRFYRNRLVRGYLGASVERKHRLRGRQPFTGFFEGDDVELRAARSAGEPGLMAYQPGPLHLINTALNLVGGEELAWQERKAASFVFSPLFCGFGTLDEEEHLLEQDGSRRDDSEQDERRQSRNGEIGRHAYRRTAHYGSEPTRLTLGTAFAISGAAASPNMGFRSSAALSFLLTVFNVRLGWWIGNPRHHKTWKKSGPLFAMLHLFMELTGKTRARTRHVYLSDGGHFENLGIYELVRRRCRYIVACDGGADADLAFQDLGNAIRKCRADFGVEIDVHVDEVRDRDERGHSPWHCAVGTIYYPVGDDDVEQGTLLYIKSSLAGDEPEDVLEYRRQNPSFPHQTTGDQFFDESQFESYRRLGHHIAMKVLDRAVDAATEIRPGGAEPVFRPEKMWLALKQHWYPQSPSVAGAFTRHTKTLDALIERLRRTDQLAFLDSQIYPEWHLLLAEGEPPEEELPEHTLWLPAGAEEKRHGFYYCNALIQLMENVYLDLNLDLEHGHPDNRGWINLFKHWSWSGMFRVTWAISAATYGHRFQAFCAQRLGLELGEVEARKLPRKGRGPLDPEEVRAMSTAEGERYLNFYEWEQVGLIERYTDCRVHAIHQLLLTIPGSSADGGAGRPLFQFGFGYALLGAGGRVLLFRIQDHLRNMGLGRRALAYLLEGPAAADRDRPDSELCLQMQSQIHQIMEASGLEAQAARAARERFEAEFSDGENRYVALLRSVRRELRGEQPVPEGTEESAG